VDSGSAGVARDYVLYSSADGAVHPFKTYSPSFFNHSVTALDAETLDELWTYLTPLVENFVVTRTNSTVIAEWPAGGVGKHSLTSFRADGTTKWELGLPDKFNLLDVLGEDGGVFIEQKADRYSPHPYETSIVAVGDDGSVKWNRTFEDLNAFLLSSTFITTCPLGGTCDPMSLHALAKDGSTKWTFSEKGVEQRSEPAFSKPLVTEEGIYVGSSRSLHKLSHDGQELWKLTLCPLALLACTVAEPPGPFQGEDGTIYVDVMGKLYAVTPDGSVRWSYDTHSGSFPPKFGSAIASSGSRMYIGAKVPSDPGADVYNKEKFVFQSLTFGDDNMHVELLV
jgi:outer membrane protein assembly factor BamB